MTRSGGRLECVCLRSYKILNHRNERTAVGFFDVRQPLDLLADSEIRLGATAAIPTISSNF